MAPILNRGLQAGLSVVMCRSSAVARAGHAPLGGCIGRHTPSRRRVLIDPEPNSKIVLSFIIWPTKHGPRKSWNRHGLAWSHFLSGGPTEVHPPSCTYMSERSVAHRLRDNFNMCGVVSSLAQILKTPSAFLFYYYDWHVSGGIERSDPWASRPKRANLCARKLACGATASLPRTAVFGGSAGSVFGYLLAGLLKDTFIRVPAECRSDCFSSWPSWMEGFDSPTWRGCALTFCLGSSFYGICEALVAQ